MTFNGPSDDPKDDHTKDSNIDSPDDHQIPSAADVHGGHPEEVQFEEPIASPSVTGEENAFSGDTTTSESPDIDEELSKLGLSGDNNGVKPLGTDEDAD